MSKIDEGNVTTDGLKEEAPKAWLEYEHAIVQAFRFLPDSKMAADGLQRVLDNVNDKQLAFTAWLHRQASRLIGQPTLALPRKRPDVIENNGRGERI
jgi:hypothetical protein